MRRRQVLTTLPAIGIAGCLAGGGPAGSGERTPPDGVELVEFLHPEPISAGESERLGVVIRNTAESDRSGTVTLELSHDADHWRTLLERTFELGPAEQAILETTASTPYLGSIRLRLAPFDRTTLVESIDQSLDFGAAYDLPNGIDLVVEDVRGIEGYEYENDGDVRTTTPESGEYWGLATVTAENVGSDPAIAPYRTDFEMLGYDWREAIPYRADGAYEGGEIPPGEAREGGLLFATRTGTGNQPIRLRHPYENGTGGVTWS